MEKHFLETVQWGVLAIVNYKGVLVSKIIGGYSCLNQKCKTPQEVDEIIEQAGKHLENSITVKNNDTMHCENKI